MILLGAVRVDEQLDKTFFGKLKPISDNYSEEALMISGHNPVDDAIGNAEALLKMEKDLGLKIMLK